MYLKEKYTRLKGSDRELQKQANYLVNYSCGLTSVDSRNWEVEHLLQRYHLEL